MTEINGPEFPSLRLMGADPERSQSLSETDLQRGCEKFYEWYLIQVFNYKEDKDIRPYLSALMNIAKTCRENGSFLGEEEIRKIMGAFHELGLGLDDGSLTFQQIPQEVRRIFEDALEQNPKAKIVGLLTLLEHQLTLQSPSLLAVEENNLRHMIEEVRSKMTPELDRTRALAASHQVEKIVRSSHAHSKQLLSELHQVMREWL